APRAPPGPVSLPRRHARPAALARRRPAGAPPRRRAVWHREARHAPYAPALLRHPSPRGRRRAPHDPASPRPSLDPFHGPLHLRLAQSARPRPAPLLPRRLHPARHAPPAGPAQPPTALHAAVPRRHADAPHRRPRSRPAGGTPRRDRRAAHLDPRPPVPSPPPLHRHGWGPRARPAAVDRHRPPPPLSG